MKMDSSMRSDQIVNMLQDFDKIINSKRLRSQITKASEWLTILGKRNIFSTENSLNSIQRYFPAAERDLVREFANNFNRNQNNDDLENVYGNIFVIVYIN